ncbi:MAG: ABC transporter ATP-binding protein [Clostridia bacterium]|nr:ABC transporter ATP-binding protein [Clostridia bacterium]
MTKRLLKFSKGYRLGSFLAALFIAFEVILEIIIPFLMSKVIDYGVEAQNMSYVVKTGLLMLLCAALSLTCGSLSGMFAAKASTGFAKNIRRAMFANIQNFSFANIDKFSTAGLITRLTTDVNNVQNSYQMLIRVFIRSPIMMTSALCMVIGISGKLSLIFVGAAIVLGTAISIISIKVHPRFRKVFKRYDDLNASVQENVNGIRVVKSFVREEHEIDKFKNMSGRIQQMFVSAEKLIMLNSPIMQLTMYSCIILFSWFGAKMVSVGDLTTGQLSSLFTYTSNILMSLMMFSMMIVMFVMSRAAAERIEEVCFEESSIRNCENPVTEVKDGSVRFTNVSFSYLDNPEKLHLKDINFEIKSGETVGIIGGTGSSKSAVVQLIPRLYDCIEGSVSVGGVDVKEYDIETLRNNVAMVLQKNVLFSGTIKENLRWGKKDATDEEMKEACRLACADEFIERFPDGYDTFIEQGGTNVSGGQRQRLCIARALLKAPKILILDDSTSAVDTATDSKIRSALKSYIPETTKIIIAQRISSIEDADKIIVLDNGKISAIGTHDELIQTSKIYNEVYEIQMKGAKA